MENIFDITNLGKRFKGFQLQGLSFSLPRGYIMGLIGPNGSGKTTTLKLMMNLMHKDTGEIKVFGQDHVRFEREIKQRVGIVYDEPVFYEQLSMRRMTGLIRTFYTKWNQAQYEGYLRRFDLNETQKIKTLSKGMRAKYALALALSHGAELLIMDEPTSGLDPVFRREMLDLLLEVMQREENSILFSTHITSDLDRVADYITFLDRGKLVFSQEKDSLYEQYRLVKGAPEQLTESLRRELLGVNAGEHGFEGLSDHEIRGEGLLTEKPTIEDIMFYFTRGNGHGR